MIDDDQVKYKKYILYPVAFLVLIWGVKAAEEIFQISFSRFGLAPGEASGLTGIIFSPLIHADLNHLISNSLPLLFLGLGLFYFYPQSSIKVSIILYIVPNILVWFFGRSAFHIGASGIVYGLVTFMFFSGIIRRDSRSIALSLVVTFLYGSLVWGVLQIDEKVSWESHLFGALTGIICAFIFRKKDPFKKYDWENEDEEESNHNEKPEISWTKGYPWEE